MAMPFRVETDLPDNIVSLDKATISLAEKRGEMEDRSVEDTITAVQYAEKESRNGQMDRRQGDGSVNDNKLDTDWQGKCNINEQNSG